MTLRKSSIEIPVSEREKITKILNQQLANLSDLYSQAKQAHWNVRGALFFQLHKLFDEVAEMTEKHIDAVAERVTALGGVARGTVRMAGANSELEECPETESDGAKLVQLLSKRYATAAKSVRTAIDETDELGDADSTDLLTDISRDLDQALWFLDASVAGASN